jgi:hypothetical protein
MEGDMSTIANVDDRRSDLDTARLRTDGSQQGKGEASWRAK